MADTEEAHLDSPDDEDSIRLDLLLRERARSSPDAALMVDLTAGISYTYRGFYAESLHWAGALRALGVHAGDRVAVILPTSADAFVAHCALGWSNAVCVPVNHQLRGRLLTHILSAARVGYVLTTRECLRANGAVLAASESVVRVAVLDTDTITAHDAPGVAAVGRAEFLRADAAIAEPSVIDPAGTQAIIFTSGTSGPAKPVALSFNAMNGYARYLFPDRGHRWTGGSGYYSPWTMAHALGSIALAVAAVRGMKLVVRDGFAADAFWDDIATHNCELALTINVAPLLWRRPRTPEDACNPLRMLAVTPLLRGFHDFERRFDVRITTIYGMTEIGPALTSFAPATNRSVGVPAPGYLCRLVDDHGGNVVTGNVGELLVRHERRSHVMTEYDGLEAATAAAWGGGWFHTGDRFVEQGGQYSFVERITDSIRHHGHNVSAFEIETEVSALPEIEACACVAHDAETEGALDQDVRLFVVLQPRHEVRADEICRQLLGRLPSYMIPRYIDVVGALPVNATGKVLKPQLRQLPITPETWDRREAALNLGEPSQAG